MGSNSQICPVPENSVAERRARCRYPVELAVRCSEKGSSEISVGTTRNMNSQGVSFKVNRMFAKGSELKLSVSWPFLLENSLPLQLVLSGPVIRTDGDGAVLKIHRYEFRIRGSNGSEELRL